jgi:hypothetical protein
MLLNHNMTNFKTYKINSTNSIQFRLRGSFPQICIRIESSKTDLLISCSFSVKLHVHDLG